MKFLISKKYVTYKGWRYCYSTEKDTDAPNPDKPWIAWVEKPSSKKEFYKDHKILWFAKRSSAKRASLRWRDAHIKKIETQRKLREKGYIAPGILCGRCEKARRLEGDYLCLRCRHGS